ncbi:MAG TPA: hypothetical protein VHS09_02535 [Polyangiaceae bacterium]|nr:hypothetical protein [Polyangiaceae bacterium]
MMDEKMSRRFVLRQSAAFGAFVAFGAACNKPAALTCTDTSSLSPADAQVRASLNYVDTSVEAGKVCSSCQQFIPAPSAGVCGTCKVVKGPINPGGNCKSFVAKPA